MNRSATLVLSAFCLLTLCSGCRSGKGPDVSGISVSLETLRFDRHFFSLDTNNLAEALQKLEREYPLFFADYTQHILGLPPLRDSEAERLEAVRRFIRDYRPVYDSVQLRFPDLRPYEERVREGLRHVKYYFPQYVLPEKLICFIGPMDAWYETSLGGQGDVITTDGLAIGLQLHLGSQFSMYHSEMGIALYPVYISRRFDPEYIPVNALRTVIDDLYPDQSLDLPLVEQMVEKGKRLYLLDLLLPDEADTLKTGYTARQLQGCRDNEGFIWSFFVRNNLVYQTDPALIKNYIGESPNTPEFGEGAPGNIGLFTGWRIVQTFMDRHPETSISGLMAMSPSELFTQSGYRPR